MDAFTIRLLIGCLLIWLVAQLIAAARSVSTRPPDQPWREYPVIWFAFVLLVALWIFLAESVPFFNFHHPR
jgi:hypothetical protein